MGIIGRVSPTVAACLIVKDEQDNLGDCLASLAGFVDAILVGDTGSSDATVAVARRAGADVFDVPWTDDFAAARNAVLARCTADWVLAIDADERLVGDAAALRDVLATAHADAMTVEIEQVGTTDVRGMSVHREVKLFRRGLASWSGRVHEQLIAHDTAPLTLAEVAPSVLALRHLGYADPERALAKARRNARLARHQLDDLVASRAADELMAAAALDLGRSYVGLGSAAEAEDVLALARSRAARGSGTWLWATDFAVRIAIEHAAYTRAEQLLDELDAVAAAPSYCRWLRAHSAVRQGEPERAAQLLDGLTELVDVGGHVLDPAQLDELRRAVAAQLSG